MEKQFETTNKFLNTVYNVFEAEMFGSKTFEKHSGILGFLKPEKLVNKEKQKFIEDADFYCSLLRSKAPEFDTLFDFGTFIRSMEKVFMYKNDVNSVVCCDTPIESKNKRTLIFNIDNITISMDLERSLDTERIDIKIRRNYGKKLSNHFIILNRDIVYNDTDDLMLINVINYTIQNIMADILWNYVLAVADRKFLDLKTYDFFNPIIIKE